MGGKRYGDIFLLISKIQCRAIILHTELKPLLTTYPPILKGLFATLLPGPQFFPG